MNIRWVIRTHGWNKIREFLFFTTTSNEYKKLSPLIEMFDKCETNKLLGKLLFSFNFFFQQCLDKLT